MEISNYAPVIIPTLNRFEHFKKCLESLEKCTGAEKTDVYIGLDYPPSENYVSGWRMIDNYLKLKEQKNGFKSLNVRRRTHNCGVLNDHSNHALLLQEVYLKNDRYIFSEDDNIFSPCFLEYINKGFEKYKNDKRVTVICGYTHPSFVHSSSSNVQCVVDTPAYGMGCWRWYDDYLNERKYDWFFSVLKESKRRTLSLFKRYPAVIYMCVCMIWKKVNSGDVRQSILNMLNNTYAICPSTSMVRNIGSDGTGLHSGYVAGRDTQDILMQDHFDLDDIELELSKENKKKLFRLNMPNNCFIRQISLIQKAVVVLVFLLFDNRNNANESFNWFISFFYNSWNRLKKLKWKLSGVLYRYRKK